MREHLSIGVNGSYQLVRRIHVYPSAVRQWMWTPRNITP